MREHGLPDDRVYAITQTPDGYVWAGTPSGLARFDGTQFTIFNGANTPDLTSEACVALAVDSAGILWVGTDNGMLCQTATGFKLFASSGINPRELRLLGRASGPGVWATSVDGGKLYHADARSLTLSKPIDGGPSP